MCEISAGTVIVGALAKAMTNIGSRVKVAGMFQLIKNCILKLTHALQVFAKTRPTAPKTATRCHLVLHQVPLL
eukprot:6191326-Pleurochrysis_carterae.AAC.1